MNFAFLKSLLPARRSWPRRRPSDTGRLGRRGERATVRLLRRTGHRVLARNYRCAAGEIDLIASDGDTLAFIEVKSRTDSSFLDRPQFDVRPAQRERIGQAARYFLSQTRSHHRPCRFDIVTVTWTSDGRPVVEHFKNAFGAARTR